MKIRRLPALELPTPRHDSKIRRVFPTTTKKSISPFVAASPAPATFRKARHSSHIDPLSPRQDFSDRKRASIDSRSPVVIDSTRARMLSKSKVSYNNEQLAIKQKEYNKL